MVSVRELRDSILEIRKRNSPPLSTLNKSELVELLAKLRGGGGGAEPEAPAKLVEAPAKPAEAPVEAPKKLSKAKREEKRIDDNREAAIKYFAMKKKEEESEPYLANKKKQEEESKKKKDDAEQYQREAREQNSRDEMKKNSVEGKQLYSDDLNMNVQGRKLHELLQEKMNIDDKIAFATINAHIARNSRNIQQMILNSKFA